MQPPLRRVIWRPCYRIIPSRYPPISLFERVADPADLEAVFAIEAMTNERLRDEVGQISLVPPHERVSGPGTSPIMAAFTHIRAEGDRFTNGTFGAFYASLAIETAIAETAWHRARFLARTSEPPQHLDMRVYTACLEADLVDIEADAPAWPDLYHPGDYTASQAFAAQQRAAGHDGIVYASVRHPGGSCAAVFRPRHHERLVLSDCRQERHLAYVWNGRAIEAVYEKSSYAPLSAAASTLPSI